MRSRPVLPDRDAPPSPPAPTPEVAAPFGQPDKADSKRLMITRMYAPDMERQVTALLVVLRTRPNGDGRAQP